MSSLPVIPPGPTQASAQIDSPGLPEAERSRIARDLANAVAGEVRFGVHDRMLYATDASLFQVEPLGVVIPASVEDAVEAIRFCAARSLPILPRGGGTSLAGQCTNRAVVLDFSASCRAVTELSTSTRTCRVEPGITIDDLNERLAPTGLFFAPDPATSRQCNIGGAIGNNAAGARSIRYGRTSESVLGIDACLADGTRVRFDRGAALRDPRVHAITHDVVAIVRAHERLIRARYPKTVRRNAGYGLDMILAQLDTAAAAGEDPMAHVNLAHLLCGSEGTLAVTLGAELALHPKPKSKGLAVVAFESVDAAIAAVQPILTTSPTAVELLDDIVIDLARANREYRRYVELLPAPAGGSVKAVLYVEYFADGGLEEVQAKFAALRGVCPGREVQSHTGEAAMLNAWKLRKAGEPLLHGIPGNRKPITFVEDNAIPVENLSEFVRRFRDIVAEHGTIAAYYAHASVGVLHVRPLVDIHSEADRAIMRSIAVRVADLARELGGVMSGEHGDGRIRGPLLERFFGPELMNAMRAVKHVFDPENRLNPGNIVEPRPIESISEHLRVKPLGRPVVVAEADTFFDYEDQHGFDAAVEMCNGAGVCRKKAGGVMCPSYMATLDERHSTRGRGNALRLAITGQLPSSGEDRWKDPETLATLHLCLSCKACKTECPSNVDIARLKAEYNGQRHQRWGASLATRLMGEIRTLNRLGAITPGIANAVSKLRLVRAAINPMMNLHPKRSLPPFSRSLASRWVRGVARVGGPRVAFFGDCFTMYNESEIGVSARRLAEAFGYRATLADVGCCARAKISLGLLGEAIDEADATLERLRPLIEDSSVRAILFLEPSCLSAVKDDWLSLKLRTPITLRRALAEKAMLVEEFLDRGWEEHPARPRFAVERATDAVLHAHCHQKALWGSGSSGNLLKRVLGSGVEVLDTTCCGMAGSFGFSPDRYDLSMKIGELGVLPAARKAAAQNAAMLATGTSCRHQIHDGAGVRAQHPVEFLASLLDP
jgi:FAD/FMN-containing dehydrogenase/Fe-S oxidoreductase